ncbi:hypothetical protein [Solibacillus sp. FSL K6-1523]|uniref:hypothetical protein n=1 Tax=Solibacillus sp. FSL K6-1523 TaxID=2921471 RepID=UPI0030F67FA0
MFIKNEPISNALIASALEDELLGTIFAHQLADEKGYYYLGLNEGQYKFHDVINDKEICINKDDILQKTFEI